MKNIYLSVIFILFLSIPGIRAQVAVKDSIYPVRGFAVGIPPVSQSDTFKEFIVRELVPAGINTLILRVDWNYDYKTHPELKNRNPWKEEDIKALSALCRKHGIRIVPQVNLLGHQSWASECGNLLNVYPQFDETPRVKLPEKYVWPNPDGLYCKSYCPNHPDVHRIVFECIGELLDAFDVSDFHAGMDEVFYIADSECPRCSGLDPARVFADEVNRIRNFLVARNCRLWIWGDRLIDGKTTGLGMWEASMNNTDRAIDMIYKDVVICDWHYERADLTAAYFGMKGFDVVACFWNRPEVTEKQLESIWFMRDNSTPQVRSHILGFAQTVWSSFDQFSKEYADKKTKKARTSGCSFIKVKETMDSIGN